MSRKAAIITAVCTVGCALGIGFVMQNGEVAKMRYGSGQLVATANTPMVGEPAQPVRVTDLTKDKDEGRLDVQQIMLTSAKIDVTPLPQAVTEMTNPETIPVPASVEVEEEIDEPYGAALEDDIVRAPACPMTARATPTAAAMVSLLLEAPCNAGERVSITHEGVSFTERMPHTGVLELLVPALDEDVRMVASFISGDTITAFAKVPSVALYERVILETRNDSGMQIHAREFGADYGSAGHVWAGAPRTFTAVAGGSGGFMTLLGDPDVASPVMLEIYSFPAALSEKDGAVTLTVEAEVTESNCGEEIEARTYQYSRGKAVSSQTLNLAVPACGAIGNFLVLNNLLQDLTVAAK